MHKFRPLRLADLIIASFTQTDIRSFEWADPKISHYLCSEVNMDPTFAFWRSEVYICGGDVNIDGTKVKYIPCATKYNKFILINNRQAYPPDVKKFIQFLEWANRLER